MRETAADEPTNTEIRELAKLLFSPAAATRATAVERLAKLGGRGRELAPEIIARLDDRSKSVRLAAAAALGALGSHAATAVERLAAGLQAADADEVAAYAAALGRIGGAAIPATDSLIALLSRDDSRVVEAARYALARLGSRAVPALVDALAESRAANPADAASATMARSSVAPATGCAKTILAAPATRTSQAAALREAPRSTSKSVAEHLVILSKERLVAHVIDAVSDVFAATGLPAVSAGREQELAPSAAPRSDITALMSVTGKLFGSVMMSMPRKLACELAGAMLGEEFSEMVPEIPDAVGELLNMTLGKIRVGLEREGIAIDHSSPEIVVGLDVRVMTRGTGINSMLRVPFACRDAELSVEALLASEVAAPSALVVADAPVGAAKAPAAHPVDAEIVIANTGVVRPAFPTSARRPRWSSDLLSDAVERVFRSLGFPDIRAGKPLEVDVRFPGKSEISATVSVSGVLTGIVLVGIGRDDALALTRVMLGGDIEDAELDSVDATGEIANMIVGELRNLFRDLGARIDQGPPHVAVGDNHQVYANVSRAKTILRVPMSWDQGKIFLDTVLVNAAGIHPWSSGLLD
ncbi:MAG: chemotaxis protein CheX [Candidatus Schekmanbacteria bacterium]|nr:chemotaxis protein CheX [Candidatus Schekmanbacteria bacterium]